MLRWLNNLVIRFSLFIVLDSDINCILSSWCSTIDIFILDQDSLCSTLLVWSHHWRIHIRWVYVLSLVELVIVKCKWFSVLCAVLLYLSIRIRVRWIVRLLRLVRIMIGTLRSAAWILRVIAALSLHSIAWWTSFISVTLIYSWMNPLLWLCFSGLLLVWISSCICNIWIVID